MRERSNPLTLVHPAMITAGSVLFTTFVSPVFETVPIFVMVPVFAVVAAFTVILASVAPDAIVTEVVQAKEFVGIFAVQVHGDTFGTERSVTHAGSVSVTVVSPVAVSGPSFFTWSV